MLTVVLLGVLTSVLSIIALEHLLTTSTAQRVERARDGVSEELDRIARDPSAVSEPSVSAIVGMRGGVWDGEGAPPTMPESWVEPLRDVVRSSLDEGLRMEREVPIGNATLVIAARPAAPGRAAWTGFLVRPLPSIATWRWIVGLLSGATLLLIAAAVHALVTLKRGTAELLGSLSALAKNLDAPVPRPAVRELAEVADGIRELAQSLARAKHEEERLGLALAQQQRLAALGRVAAGVAHEVRNPLASIKLRLDLAAAGAVLPPIVDSAIGHASSEIARLDRLVADLLVVSGGRTVSSKAPASLGALVRARADALAPWAKEREVTFAIDGDARASIDADSISRAVDNFLRNAVEASPKGGRVKATVTRRGGHAVVRVEDEGTGVDVSRAAELFEPFFTTKPEGTGLGLAISRAIARAHGGDATYAREGNVTRFELTLEGATEEREAAE
jgi:signal transduction histidine kinase